ncbi:hypothetical protein LOAG_08552, partial [Loa loa]
MQNPSVESFSFLRPLYLFIPYIQSHIIHIHTYIYIWTYTYTRILHTYTHTHIHTYIHTHTYTYTYIYAHIHINTYICIIDGALKVSTDKFIMPLFSFHSIHELSTGI